MVTFVIKKSEFKKTINKLQQVTMNCFEKPKEPMTDAECKEFMLDCEAGLTSSVHNYLLRNKIVPEVFSAAEGYTPFMLACLHGHAKIVELLIDKVKLNVSNKNGHTALMLASRAGHVGVVHMLLNYDADINAVDNGGHTALMLASRDGHVKVVQILLNTGAEVNVVDDRCESALMFASRNGEVEIVKMLLDHGANPRVINKHGYTAVMLATQSGYDEVVGLIMKKIGPLAERLTAQTIESKKTEGTSEAEKETTPTNSDTAIIKACKLGRNKVVKMLLDKGEDANVTTSLGNTPLMIAVKRGDVLTVEVLLGNVSGKASINTANKHGHTPLVFVCQKGPTEIARLLFHGAGVNRLTVDGFTPLIQACIAGHTEIVRILLSYGANVNVVAGNGDTPLTLACYYRHKEIVELLLANGADPKVTGVYGKTAYEIASQKGHVDIVNLLNASDPNQKQEKTFEESLKQLRADSINLVDEDGYSALMYACKNSDREEIVKILLRNGANSTLKNKYGQTALMIAVIHGHTETVRLLSEKC